MLKLWRTESLQDSLKFVKPQTADSQRGRAFEVRELSKSEAHHMRDTAREILLSYEAMSVYTEIHVSLTYHKCRHFAFGALAALRWRKSAPDSVICTV